MADTINPATLRHLAIVLYLSAAATGCGGSKKPADQAAAPKPAGASGQNPSNTGGARPGPNDSAAKGQPVVLKDRNGKPIPMIDASKIKMSNVPIVVDRATGRAYEDIPENRPVTHRAEAGDPGPDGWCVAESTRGHFSVSVPGKFSDALVKSRTTTGGTGVMHTIARKTADGTEFNVLETEVIGTRPQTQIDQVQKMIDEYQKKGATVKRSEMTLAGVRADRLSLEAKGISAEIVLVTVADRDYMLGVQWRPPAPTGLPDDVERFFASFEVKQKSAPTESAKPAEPAGAAQPAMGPPRKVRRPKGVR